MYHGKNATKRAKKLRVRQWLRSFFYQRWAKMSKHEQIPLFYPRGWAAPLRGLAPIAILKRFVLYCSSELIILGQVAMGHAPGHGSEGTGNCSSCYAVKTPLACSWSELWLCSRLAVQDCQGLTFSTMAFAMRLAQSGSTTPHSSILANSHSSTG